MKTMNIFNGILLSLLIVASYAQAGPFGCLTTLNMDINCPLNRTLEIDILTGFDVGGNSDALDLIFNFYDKSNNYIAQLSPKWTGCNVFQRGNIDTLRGCAPWVQAVESVRVSVMKSDQLQVQAMTVSLGSRIQIRTRFWLDDLPQGTYVGNWPAYNSLQFRF